MKQRKKHVLAAIIEDLQVMARDSRNDNERRIIEREIRRLQTIQRQKEIRQQSQVVR